MSGYKRQIAPDNVVVTPHLGWYTDGAVERILKLALADITAFMQDEPINQLA